MVQHGLILRNLYGNRLQRELYYCFEAEHIIVLLFAMTRNISNGKYVKSTLTYNNTAM